MAQRDEKGRFLVGTEPGPGRTSSYDPAMDEQVFKLALLGMTDKEIAVFFGVSVETINVWKRQHSGFMQSLLSGREQADANVAASLYKRAIGMEIFEERLAHKGGVQEVVRVRREIPPDTGAASQWLSIRQRKRWAQKVEDRDPEQAGNDADGAEESRAVGSMSDDEILARIETLKARLAMD